MVIFLRLGVHRQWLSLQAKDRLLDLVVSEPYLRHQARLQQLRELLVDRMKLHSPGGSPLQPLVEVGTVVSGVDDLLDEVRSGLSLPPYDGLHHFEVFAKDLVEPLLEGRLVTKLELLLQPASVLVRRGFEDLPFTPIVLGGSEADMALL